MTRSGYTDECEETWDWVRWRGIVASSIRGKRGQKMLRDLLVALDAMPVKELHSDVLVEEDGSCCAIGALLKHREVPGVEQGIDPYVGNDWIAEELDVAEPLVQEIEWMNDEFCYGTPENRWGMMRAWIVKQLRETING